MNRPRILIADDEPLYMRTTGDLLRKEGYDCVCVASGDHALQILKDEHFDLILSDLNMPGNLKLELLREHSTQRPSVPIIVITGVPSLPTAIESIRLGITDYLLKPVKFEDLLFSVRRALAKSKPTHIPTHTSGNGASAPARQHDFPSIIGASPAIVELFEIMDRVAHTDTNILITGESGTGKEIVARALHDHSHRRDGMFQVIDCTAVPESLFESMLFGHKKGSFTGALSDQPGLLKQCDGGTAFFDELGELPLTSQAKLLRAVQEQTFTPVGSHSSITVDTRFICATNRDLQMEVNAGRFRQDLFYRLGVIHIELPPLRERDEDVVLLADYFLKHLRSPQSPATSFSDAAIECLRRYRWPGNIRELRNVIERAIAMAQESVIVPENFPVPVRQAVVQQACTRQAALPVTPSLASQLTSSVDNWGSLPTSNGLSPTSQRIAAGHTASREEAMRDAEHQYLMELMQECSGNVSQAARQAEISRQGLHKLLKQHDIDASYFRHS